MGAKITENCDLQVKKNWEKINKKSRGGEIAFSYSRLAELWYKAIISSFPINNDVLFFSRVK